MGLGSSHALLQCDLADPSLSAWQFENPANADIHRETTGPEIWRDTNGKVGRASLLKCQIVLEVHHINGFHAWHGHSHVRNRSTFSLAALAQAAPSPAAASSSNRKTPVSGMPQWQGNAGGVCLPCAWLEIFGMHARSIVAVEPSESPVLSGGSPGPHKIQGIGAGFVPGVLNTKIYDEVIQVHGICGK